MAHRLAVANNICFQFFYFSVQSSCGHDFVRKTPMSEDLLIRHCSPTLAGIKTGNLFSCACPSRKDLTRDLCRLNKKLVPRGIRILPLRVRKGRALIYAYRPNALESDLTDHRARALLLKYGYVPENPNGCVVHLIHRLRMCWASSAIGRAITSAWAAGRSTATNRPPGASLKNTRCAAKSTPGSGSKGNPSSSSPWLVDVSTITNPERKVVESYE